MILKYLKIIQISCWCVLLSSCSRIEEKEVDYIRQKLIEEANWEEPINFFDLDDYGLFESSEGIFLFKKDEKSKITVLIEDRVESFRFHVDGHSSALTYWLNEDGSYDKLLVHDSEKNINMFDADSDGILEELGTKKDDMGGVAGGE